MPNKPITIQFPRGMSTRHDKKKVPLGYLVDARNIRFKHLSVEPRPGLTLSFQVPAVSSGSVEYPLAIHTSCPIDAAESGTAYSYQLEAIGGSGDYVYWEITAGALPSGLSLDPDTGEISGTPSDTATTYNFTFQVTDSEGNQASKSCSIVLYDAMSITCPTGTGFDGVVYSSAYSVSGGSGGYSYEITSGALPDGLSLNTSTGDITGTPTVQDTFDFTVTVTDSEGFTATHACEIIIASMFGCSVSWPGFYADDFGRGPDADLGSEYDQYLTSGTGLYADGDEAVSRNTNDVAVVNCPSLPDNMWHQSAEVDWVSSSWIHIQEGSGPAVYCDIGTDSYYGAKLCNTDTDITVTNRIIVERRASGALTVITGVTLPDNAPYGPLDQHTLKIEAQTESATHSNDTRIKVYLDDVLVISYLDDSASRLAPGNLPMSYNQPYPGLISGSDTHLDNFYFEEL